MENPPCFMSNRYVGEERNQEWTREDDKIFEYALNIFDEDTPDRWENVAAVLPRKSVNDVIKRYKKLQEDVRGLEAGYFGSSSSSEMVGDHNHDESRKRSAMENPQSFMSNPYVGEERNQEWTREDDKMFEYALNIFDEDTPDRWENVAVVLPRKSVNDVIKRYKKLQEDVRGLEAGYFGSSSSSEMVGDHKKLQEDVRGLEAGYFGSSSSSEMVGDHNHDESRKRSATTDMSYENKRKKVVHWTEEEHKLFLDGLQKCGNGNWKAISRNFVVTKTHTQVASHAQKYFNRQKLLSDGGKDKKRRSIHDITLENTTQDDEVDKSLPLFQEKNPIIQRVQPEWISYEHNNNVNDQLMAFNPNNNIDDMSMVCNPDPYQVILGTHDLFELFYHHTRAKPQSSGSKMADDIWGSPKL